MDFFLEIIDPLLRTQILKLFITFATFYFLSELKMSFNDF